MNIQVNKIYKLDDLLLRCTKFSETNIGTFQIVDEHFNDVIIRDENSTGVIKDYGIRIIKNRLPQLVKVDKNINKQLTLF